MIDRAIDLFLGVAEAVLWCLFVGLVAGAIGWACADLRFRRRK